MLMEIPTGVPERNLSTPGRTNMQHSIAAKIPAANKFPSL